MTTILDEFQERRSLLIDVNFEDAGPRLGSLIEWLDGQSIIKTIIEQIRAKTSAEDLLKDCNFNNPPKASSPDEIAAIGIFLMERCRDGGDLWKLAYSNGINPSYSTNKPQDYSDEAFNRFIEPTLNMIGSKLTELEEGITPEDLIQSRLVSLLSYSFRYSYPETTKILEKISSDLTESDSDQLWSNIGNSCRRALLAFTQELRNNVNVPIPKEFKEGDVKKVTRHILKEEGLTGKYTETLSKLMDALWDHIQTILHRRHSTRSDAERCYLWTALVISEIVNLVDM